MSTPVRVLFFDVGGILLTNGWGHESREKAARLFDLDYAEMDELHKFIFPVYEMGKITLDQYLDIVVFNQPRSFGHEEFKDFMFAQSEELPGMLSWLKSWKKESGFTIISINNEGKELNDYRIEKFGLRDCFDAFISSCEVKMRKPDPDIFDLALGIARVGKDECVYFDDRKMFADMAGVFGLKAYQHKSFAETKAILENLKKENLVL
ncbi:MAG: HAD-IA family hydrolase [Mucilaginibacter polytrichastri]|nr:HAD-IA family hydrolase [Mucilaginibacter polytrichastri]